MQGIMEAILFLQLLQNVFGYIAFLTKWATWDGLHHNEYHCGD